ncbi:MAG TPA: hypothetical protein VL486_09670 [Verrucomicrobiae bacterium]|nr:hypothetical protein [Verrucomicrobiae bacterium]
MTHRQKKPGRPRAEDQKPMLTAQIVKAYGETGSLEKTAARCGIAPNTVRAILMRNPEDFAAAKKALATRMFAVAGDAVDISGERIGECSSPQAAVVAGIFAQRGTELLEDHPERLSINVAVLQSSLADLETLLKQRDEILAATGGGEKPQKSVAERGSRAADRQQE